MNETNTVAETATETNDNKGKLLTYVYTAAVGVGDVVKVIKVVPAAEATDQFRKDAARNKLRVLTLEDLVASTRIFRENFAIKLSAINAKEADTLSDAELGQRITDTLLDWIDADEQEAAKADKAPAPAASTAGKKGAGTNKAPATLSPEAQAAADNAKAEALAKKAQEKAEREAAAARKKEEAEKAKAEAKAKREEEAKAKAEAKEKAAAEGKAELDRVQAEQDEIVAAVQAEYDAIKAKLDEAKAARATALKEVAENFNIAVPGGTGTIANVPKSTAFILTEDYTGLDGKTIPKDSKLTVKMIHLAGIRAGMVPSRKEEIVAEIKKYFPNGSTSVKDVNWHWNMVKTGKMDIDTGARIG